MSEVKPCPFCGGDEIDDFYNETPMYSQKYKRCNDCYSEAKNELWNTRPIEDELHARIAELEGSLDAALKQYEHQVSYNAALEQWQTDAVSYLKEYFIFGEINANEWETERLRELEDLIKQAEDDAN